MKRIFNLIIIFLFIGNYAWTQELVTEEAQEPQDLKTQFDALKGKAETYGEYKVFRITSLNEFWSVVNDSINNLKNNVSEKQVSIDDQQSTISELQIAAKENEEKFQQNEFAATHINFLGIDFTKSAFIGTVSVLIIGLVFILVIGYLQFSRNRNIALKSASECSKLEHELEDLRKKSLEKQIKLNRDLQTERNKIEELRNKSTISKRISA